MIFICSILSSFELTDEIREKRVEIANNLLNYLSNSSKQKFNKVLTQDDTWIYLYNLRESMRIENRSEIPKRVNHTISSSKAMISVT